jgi:tetratricopeptide (TPR) repeat protein
LGLAIAPVQAASPSADDVARAYYFFLQGLAAEGRDDSNAIVNYRQALQILPDNAAIHVQLAAAHARQGDNADAMAEAKLALVSDANNVEAHRLLGWLQAGSASRLGAGGGAVADEAIGHLERALAAEPGDVAAGLVLADLYLRRKQSEPAIRLLSRLLADRPGYPPALRLLVDANRRLGRSAEADEIQGQLGSATPDPIELRTRQIARMELSGDWRSAEAAWDDLIGQDVGTGIYRPRRVIALLNNGDAKQARELLTEVVADWPKIFPPGT